MNTQIATIGNVLPAATPETLERILDAEGKLSERPQVEIPIEHVLHGGMYARTCRLPGNFCIVGALIKVPTIVIVNGDTLIFAGEQWQRLEGFNVMPAASGRKCIFITQAPTEITMMFPTKAKTVAEAEAEFTEEVAKLQSTRRHGEGDLITITGE